MTPFARLLATALQKFFPVQHLHRFSPWQTEARRSRHLMANLGPSWGSVGQLLLQLSLCRN
jgi:membrane protein required for beta-lactamase induction